MEPTVGRIVHYYADRDADPLPLLITHVHGDKCVSGVVSDAFGPSGSTYAARSVEELTKKDYDGPRWEWPPRV